MANIYSNILSGMMDAFASVISNNLNIVMKLLATVTIVLSIPTMIASFFGMNFDVIPLGHNPYGFVITIVITLLISLLVAYSSAKRICSKKKRKKTGEFYMNFIDRLEKRYPNFGVSNLMIYVIAISGLGMLISMVNPYIYYQYLSLDFYQIFHHGQVWRLITFLLCPSAGGSGSSGLFCL